MTSVIIGSTKFVMTCGFFVIKSNKVIRFVRGSFFLVFWNSSLFVGNIDQVSMLFYSKKFSFTVGSTQTFWQGESNIWSGLYSELQTLWNFTLFILIFLDIVLWNHLGPHFPSTKRLWNVPLSRDIHVVNYLFWRDSIQVR